MTADPPTPCDSRRRVHLARFVSPAGAVSPTCARTPRAINMKRGTWSTDPSAVTCQGCLKATPYSTPRERAQTGHTYEYDLAAWEAGGRVGAPPVADASLKAAGDGPRLSHD